MRSDARTNNKWFPRDAGLLEGSTGMGVSLSLLVAAVPLCFVERKRETK